MKYYVLSSNKGISYHTSLDDIIDGKSIHEHFDNVNHYKNNMDVAGFACTFKYNLYDCDVVLNNIKNGSKYHPDFVAICTRCYNILSILT